MLSWTESTWYVWYSPGLPTKVKDVEIASAFPKGRYYILSISEFPVSDPVDHMTLNMG